MTLYLSCSLIIFSIGMSSINENIRQSESLNGDSLCDKDYYLEMEDVSDEECLPEELKGTPDYEELMWLKRIRREKELEQREERNQPTMHFGYKCDGCGQDPILGGRFTCVDCAKNDQSIDLCCDCAQKLPRLKRIGIEIGHKYSHKIRPVRKRLNDVPSRESLCKTRDQDYFIQSKTGNYLDPNYQYLK